MTRSARRPSKLSSSLQQRLNAYAIAGSAAGLGMLALTQPAEAKIIYHRTHHVIGPHETYRLSLNHKGTDFVIFEHGSFSVVANLSVKGLGNAVRGTTFLNTSSADRLNKGSVVSSKGTFVGSKKGALMAKYYCSSECGYEKGQWPFKHDGYLGLKFKIGKQIHFGWARLIVQETGNYAFKATLTGYAFESIPNKSIVTGQTHDDMQLQPLSLGHLAAGSAGR